MSKAKTSPRGIAIYPKLNQPDTKFVDDGVYTAKLRMDLDDPQAKAFIEQIDAWHEESKEQAVAGLVESKGMTKAAAVKKVKDGDKPYAFEEDEDGEETNFVLVNFKMRAVVKARKTGKTYKMQPAFFDAHGTRLQGDAIPQVWGGSELRVAFNPVLWFTPKLGASVSLRMEAVKILRLVSGTGASAADYGFDEDEDGYTGTDAAHSSDFDGDESDDGDGGSADF